VVDGRVRHLGRTVEKDGQWGALESVQSLRHVWKCRRPEVSPHDSVEFLSARLDLPLRDSRTQRGFGEIPEVLVALHERSQRGKFELLLPPQRRRRLQISEEIGCSNDDKCTSNNVPYASKTKAPGLRL
jgi:hypothetical protein